jgi:aerobic carbon-monoxide dehydrogenase large subunit
MTVPVFGNRPKHSGVPGPCREDDRLLAGRGTYVADLRLPNMVELVIARSVEAHARFTVNLEAARSSDGVVGAFVAEDLQGVESFPDFFPYAHPVAQYPLARDRVRFVGQAVAAIAAEDRYLGEDAAELVQVAYERLPVVSSLDGALSPDAPKLFDEWPDNRMVHLATVRDEVTEQLDRGRRVQGRFRVGRHSGTPIEGRAYAAEFRDGRLTLWSNTQHPHMTRTTLSYVLPLTEREIRVVSPDVGGAFGVKQSVYPEEVLVCWLAIQLERPVRFLEDRAEHMVSAAHARDVVIDLEASVDDDGTILAMRGHVMQDLGSGEIFPAGFCPSLVTAGHLTGPYRIEQADSTVTCVVTNKTPSGPYRGYGIPEGVFAHERLIEKIARATGIDSVELRMRMLLTDDDLPFTTPHGGVLDSGSFRECFERVVEAGRAAHARARAACVADPSARVGVGYAAYREGTAPTHFGSSGHWTGQEAATVSIDPDGSVRVASGVTPQGQGTETFVATIAAEVLGVELESVRVILGDTDQCPYGLGAWGSRGAVLGGNAVLRAARRVRDKLMDIAAHQLEASSEDLVCESGRITVAGAPGGASVGVDEIATIASIHTFKLPDGMEPGLDALAVYEPPGLQHFPDAEGRINAAAAWANAAHAAIVKVNIETGEVRIMDYHVVHDCGPIINPLIVDGQVIGGVAQGIGGALYEDLPYSSEGQPLAVTFMDYIIPSSVEMPPVALDHVETVSPGTPLGIKGAGEGGTCGALAAVANAVEDALSEFEIEIDETPITPAAIRGALSGRTKA